MDSRSERLSYKYAYRVSPYIYTYILTNYLLKRNIMITKLPEAALTEFIALYLNSTGELLPDDQATIIALTILNIVNCMLEGERQ